MKAILRLLINALALYMAARFVPGIDFTGSIPSLLLVALVFGVVNTFLKPIVKLFAFPALFLTLGAFALVINTAMLALTAALMDDLTIDGFVPAFLGALLISVVGAVLNKVFADDDDR